MTLEIPRPVLKDHKALVAGIANEHSIAYGCAQAFRTLGITAHDARIDLDLSHRNRPKTPFAPI